jgi:hypothetical protein
MAGSCAGVIVTARSGPINPLHRSSIWQNEPNFNFS